MDWTDAIITFAILGVLVFLIILMYALAAADD